MTQLKQRLMRGILDNIPDTVLNGPASGAPHILNISFLSTEEILLHALEAKTYTCQQVPPVHRAKVQKVTS